MNLYIKLRNLGLAGEGDRPLGKGLFSLKLPAAGALIKLNPLSLYLIKLNKIAPVTH
jgi:hypothetical protein